MDQKIKYFDFLFEGFTSDLIEEKNNKKKPKNNNEMDKPKRNDPYWIYLKMLEDPGWLFKPWLHRDTKKKRKKQKKLKKTVKKPKKNPDGTTSSGRHPGPPQDIVSNEWYP